VRLVKRAQGRWGDLVGDSPDRTFPFRFFFSGGTTYIPNSTALTAPTVAAPAPSTSTGVRKPQKNWDALTTTILSSEKEKTTEEDPNVGGDSTLNSFFQKIFGDADEDTKRAMMKSYQESGGTTLSTNWDEVKKAKVEVKPPAGAEWKKWN
jgi:suppressor of G2 allele of SKP1